MVWTLNFLDRTSAASSRIWSEVSFALVGSGLDLDFAFAEKPLLVVWLA